MGSQQVVLLIEDDADDALFIRVGLLGTRPDVRLVVVSDGVQAMNYLQGKQPFAQRLLFPFPDLILLDLRLPVISGFQVLKWIRGQTNLKDVPVVVLTGSLDKRDQKTCDELGASAYVLKPFGLENMRTVIREIAESSLSRKDRPLSAVAAWEHGGEKKAA